MLRAKFFKHSTLFLFCSTFFLSGCDWFGCGCADLSGLQYTMKVVDEQGENLLDTLGANAINPADVRLYRIEGGQEVLVRLKGGVDIQGRHGVARAYLGGEDGIGLYWGEDMPEENFAGIIQWAENDRDTLMHEFNASGKRKHLVRILRRDEVLWEAGRDAVMRFTFVK